MEMLPGGDSLTERHKSLDGALQGQVKKVSAPGQDRCTSLNRLLVNPTTTAQRQSCVLAAGRPGEKGSGSSEMLSGGLEHLGVQAQQGGEAQKGMLLLQVVPDVAQSGAPDGHEELQVGSERLGADPGNPAECDCTAPTQTGIKSTMTARTHFSGSVRVHGRSAFCTPFYDRRQSPVLVEAVDKLIEGIVKLKPRNSQAIRWALPSDVQKIYRTSGITLIAIVTRHLAVRIGPA